MFQLAIIISIGILIFLWMRHSQGAPHCSGCSGCPYQQADNLPCSVDDTAENGYQTLDRIKSGKQCLIKSLPEGAVKDQTIRFGLTEGKKVLCQTVIPAGPVVLKVDRQEIAIGRNLAKQIRVGGVENEN